MDIRDQRQIVERREEIERELKELLDQARSKASVGDIKKIVYHEEDSDDMMKIVALFDTGDGAVELSTALEAASNAWNYFPHKTLGGLSPAEKVLEYQRNVGGGRNDRRVTNPRVLGDDGGGASGPTGNPLDCGR